MNLDRLAGGAFAEIVYGGQGDDQVAVGVGGVADEGEVGAGGPFGLEWFLVARTKGQCGQKGWTPTFVGVTKGA